MAKRFINDDFLIMFQKTVPSITEDELKQRLCNAVLIHDGQNTYNEMMEWAAEDEDENDPLPWGYAVSVLLNCSDRIRDKKDVLVDHENIDLEWDSWHTRCSGTSEPAKYLGIHTINGFTFCGALTGGDWEWPIFVVLYWDGEDIQIYIPKRGNKVNMDAMTAFGSEGDEFDEFWGVIPEVGKRARAKYSQLGLWEPSEDPHEYIDWSELYVKQYGFQKVEDVSHNWEAMMNEIFENITIK